VPPSPLRTTDETFDALYDRYVTVTPLRQISEDEKEANTECTEHLIRRPCTLLLEAVCECDQADAVEWSGRVADIAVEQPSPVQREQHCYSQPPKTAGGDRLYTVSIAVESDSDDESLASEPPVGTDVQRALNQGTVDTLLNAHGKMDMCKSLPGIGTHSMHSTHCRSTPSNWQQCNE
jgi:hypothetical protein